MDADCRHILADLELFLDGECPQHIEHIVQRHLQDCGVCLSRADFERALRECIAARCSESAPSDLARKIVATLEQTA